MRKDLMALFDRAELTKYFTEEELPPEMATGAEPSLAGQAVGQAEAGSDDADPAAPPRAPAPPAAREETR
jgi:hypothetical protein